MVGEGHSSNEETLFTEKIPPYLINSKFRSHAGIRVASWVFRIIGIMTSVLLVEIFLDMTPSALNIILGVVGVFSTLLLLSLAEYYASFARSATPIQIHRTGIVMPLQYYDRLRGLERNVPYGAIDRVTVERKDAFQNMGWGQGNGIQWHDAPLSLTIQLKNGKKMRSGLKSPGQVAEMAQLLTSLGVTVVDSGKGMGRMVQVRNGREVG